MMDEAQQRTNDLRNELIIALYSRRSGAHEAEKLRSLYLRAQYSLTEIETALTDLKKFGYVESFFESEMATVPQWQITAKGISYKERGFRS